MDGNFVKILIADDDPEDMELIEDAILLAEPTAELHKFTNGLSAYEYLRTRSDDELPCLIILDYNMPQLTGAEVLSSLSKQPRYRPIPKIVLSTSNSTLHKKECMNSGATEYFTKPSSMKDLNNLAKKMVTFCL
jgi:CheY-like chemotaxis protein